MSVLHAQLIALAVATLATAAAAQTVETTAPEVRPLVVAAIQPAVASDDDLAALAGGAAVAALTEQNISAVVSGNAVNADTVNTGAVSLNANAFSGFSGIGNFVINTGNNNNLQGSLSVNIVMTPGG